MYVSKTIAIYLLFIKQEQRTVFSFYLIYVENIRLLKCQCSHLLSGT